MPPRFSNNSLQPTSITRAQAPPFNSCHRIRIEDRFRRAASPPTRKYPSTAARITPTMPIRIRSGRDVLDFVNATPNGTTDATPSTPSIRYQICMGDRTELPDSTPICPLPVTTTTAVNSAPTAIMPIPAAMRPPRTRTLKRSKCAVVRLASITQPMVQPPGNGILRNAPRESQLKSIHPGNIDGGKKSATSIKAT